MCNVDRNLAAVMPCGVKEFVDVRLRSGAYPEIQEAPQRVDNQHLRMPGTRGWLDSNCALRSRQVVLTCVKRDWRPDCQCQCRDKQGCRRATGTMRRTGWPTSLRLRCPRVEVGEEVLGQIPIRVGR